MSGLFLYSYLPGSVCSPPVSLSIHLWIGFLALLFQPFKSDASSNKEKL